MNILVLQHVAVEHPGVYRDFLREDGLSWRTVQLDEGEEIPRLEPFDLMIVMGGPQDVWQEDEYPWMRAEKAAIRRFVVDLQRPYFGVCLGHQLLAEAVGGRVGPAKSPEVGVLTVSKTSMAASDQLLQELDDPIRVLQWHGAEVAELPAGSKVLASTAACPVQAFRFGKHAYGIQFHSEVTSDTVPQWAAIPEYEAALERAMGPGAMQRLAGDVRSALPEFNRNARKIYNNLRRAWRERG
jgi:GMP synthase-like glutamine amidotransferase